MKQEGLFEFKIPCFFGTTENNLKFCVNYKIKRIGHGIAFILDNNIKEYLIENNIILEFCPISNQYFHNLMIEIASIVIFIILIPYK